MQGRIGSLRNQVQFSFNNYIHGYGAGQASVGLLVGFVGLDNLVVMDVLVLRICFCAVR